MINTPIRPPRSLPAVLRRAALSRALCSVLALAPWFAYRAAAQEAPAPAAEAAPAEEAPAAKPKPKPRKVVAKPRPVEKPAEAKAADAKEPDAREPDAKRVDAKTIDKGARTAAADGTLLVPAPAQTRVQWPNGARTVSESYGDWTMNCQRENGHTDCVVIQSQGDRRSGKRQFSVELKVPQDGRAEGLILMPFGMQIEPGVTFKLDDRTLGKGAPYSYCVADGCLVSVSLPTVATDAMKTAQSLSVTATKTNATEPPVIAVPLAGFATAFERAIAYGG